MKGDQRSHGWHFVHTRPSSYLPSWPGLLTICQASVKLQVSLTFPCSSIIRTVSIKRNGARPDTTTRRHILAWSSRPSSYAIPAAIGHIITVPPVRDFGPHDAGKPDAGPTCSSGLEGAGRRHAPAMVQRAALPFYRYLHSWLVFVKPTLSRLLAPVILPPLESTQCKSSKTLSAR